MRKDEVDRRLRALGKRLRALRVERGMSLIDVERLSEGQLKGVVVGSYERGDRNVTITRLSEIAEFYGVLLGDLMLESEGARTPASALDEVLRRSGIEARVTDWHHPVSATRGVAVRLKAADAQRLSDVLQLRQPPRRADSASSS